MQKYNDDLLIKIDAYIKGHLPEQEAQALAREIAANEVLAARVERQRLHLAALDILLEDDLRAKMQVWKKEKTTQSALSTKRKWLRFGALALLIFVGLIGWFTLKTKTATLDTALTKNTDSLNNNKKILEDNKIKPTQKLDTPSVPNQIIVPKTLKTPEKPSKTPQKPIASNNSTPFDFSETNDQLLAIAENRINQQIARGAEKDSLVQEIVRFIKAKNYQNALILSEKLKDTEGGYLQGIIYFLAGKQDKALPFFQNLANQKGFEGADAAGYFAALCFIANGQKAEAVQRLKKIAAEADNDFSNAAKKVLQQL